MNKKRKITWKSKVKGRTNCKRDQTPKSRLPVSKISGHLVQGRTHTRGANPEISEFLKFISNLDGIFFFRGVRPGR